MQANYNLLRELSGVRRFADFIADAIAETGTKKVFALPAESLNPLIEAIRRHPVLEMVAVRHESCASVMAWSYARTTGTLGVCLGTAGPGSTHMPMGAYLAKATRVPLLLISGQVWKRLLGDRGFQEIDSRGLFEDSCLRSIEIGSAEQLDAMRRVFIDAVHQRGPLHLALPSDVCLEPIAAQPQIARRLQVSRGETRVSDARLQARWHALTQQDAPLTIWVGPTAAGDVDALRRLLARTGARALIDADGCHENGLAELPGSLLERADANERLAGSPVLALNIPAACLALHRGVQLALYSAPHAPLTQLGDDVVVASLAGLLDKLASGQRERPLERALDTPHDESMRGFWRALAGLLDADNGQLVVEPGPLSHSFLAHAESARHRALTAGAFGWSGLALPAAIGAAVAEPARRTVAICSSQGLRETWMEVQTLSKYGLALDIVCFAASDDEVDYDAFSRAGGIVFAGRGAIDMLPEALGQRSQSARLFVLTVELPAAVSSQHGADDLTPVVNELRASRLISAHAPSNLSARAERLLEELDLPVLRSTQDEAASMAASGTAKVRAGTSLCIVSNPPQLVAQLNGLYDSAYDRSRVLLVVDAGPSFALAGVAPERLLTPVADRVVVADRVGWRAALRAALQETAQHGGLTALVLPAPLRVEDDDVQVPQRAPAELTHRLQPALVAEAAASIATARRPTILLGRGGIDAWDRAFAFARRLEAPVVVTMPARRPSCDGDEMFVGALGASGHLSATDALANTDCLIILGSSARGLAFGWSGDFRVVQVDLDSSEFGRRPHPTIGMLSSVAGGIEALSAVLFERGPATQPTLLQDRRQRRRALRKQFVDWCARAARVLETDESPVRPPAICHALANVIDEQRGRTLVTVDVGINTLWAYRHLVQTNAELVWTSSFATMGFSVPAAVANAQLAPDRPVAAIVGDGGIGITLGELIAASRLRRPLPILVFNNSKLAAIKYEQEVMGWPEHEARLQNFAFADLARGCGLHGETVRSTHQLLPSLRRAFAADRPTVIDVVTDPHELPSPPRIHPRQAAGLLLAVTRETRTHGTRRAFSEAFHGLSRRL